MIIFPAIDLYEGKAVRLYKGDYAQLTVYDENPINTAKKFIAEGATHIHMVDLEGARDGNTPNFETVRQIVTSTDLFVEIGGGIRSMETLDKYFSAGVSRVILGTSAVTDEEFLKSALAKYGEKIAVGADIKDGEIATHGWTKKSGTDADTFFRMMQDMGVSTIICTDVSRDGALMGTNIELYRHLLEKFSINIIASGGITTVDEVFELAKMNMFGAILGKAIYNGNIDLAEAVKAEKI
jgi:phosphoribosylformimino-5-aminoimidazole carboxamide ribotide isomerase